MSSALGEKGIQQQPSNLPREDGFFMQMQTQRQYYCYKRYVAQALMAHGFQGEKVPNVMYPDRGAWAFDLTPQLARFLVNYYNDRNLSAPRFLVDYLAENGGAQ